MPGLDGLAATAAIRALDDSPRILILTTFNVDDHVFRALQAGADGFLLKDSPPHDLIDAIRVIAAGDSMLSPSVTRTLISHFTTSSNSNRHADQRLLSTLTPRERDVLIELTSGLSNAEIGSSLFMSGSTVEAHITHLFTKLACSNRVQLAILARDADLA